MPIEVISTDQASAYSADAGDDIFLRPDVLISSSDDGITSTETFLTDTTLNLRGDIIAEIGVDFLNQTSQNNDVQIYIGAEGSIDATADGIAMDGGANNNIVNHGDIVAQEQGIYVQGGEIRVENHGNITSFGGSSQGAIAFYSGAGGTNVREVINTGVISGAPVSQSSPLLATISNRSGVEFHLDNSGSIFGTGSTAVYSAATSNTINNSGLIDGDVMLVNLASMTNTGVISGSVTLSNDSDYYDGSAGGVVLGTLNLGGGDDFAYMGDGGSAVFAGSGDDDITGGTGVDFINGEDDDDVIRGRSGADDLSGGDGNDTIRAGRGDDFLDGGEGNDFMRGGAGDDDIFGGSGNDLIYAGSGEDIISGGLGQDTMFGNGGADTFVFTSAAESTNAGAAWDRIMDFTQGQDLIDLSQFNARFIGTGAYAANGNIAEVRIFEDPNGDTRVFVDVNADGTSDMRFYLVNVTGVTADDFIL